MRVTHLLLIRMSLILPYFLKNLSTSFSRVLGGMPPRYTLVDIFPDVTVLRLDLDSLFRIVLSATKWRCCSGLGNKQTNEATPRSRFSGNRGGYPAQRICGNITQVRSYLRNVEF